MIKAETMLAWLVGLLAFLGVAFTSWFMINGGNNEGFEDYPTITTLHVAPGLLYLALAPFQFSRTIRNRFPVFHRWSGRLLVVLGLILGSAALFIGLVFPYSGLPEQIVTGGFGLFFLFSIIQGFRNARARQFTVHREWMMRAFAIGLAIVTMRLIFIPILIMIGGPTREQAEFFSIFSFTVAFIIHAIVAELWIRSTRPGPVMKQATKPQVVTRSTADV